MFSIQGHLKWSEIILKRTKKTLKRWENALWQTIKYFSMTMLNAIQKNSFKLINVVLTWKSKRQKIEINQQQQIQQLPLVAADKEEMFSTKETKEQPVWWWVYWKKNKVMAKRMLERKEKRRLLAAKNKNLRIKKSEKGQAR